MEWEQIVWLGLMVAFLLAEGACPIHLVSIWFAVGSLVALVASMLGAQLAVQIVLFAVVSCALLALLWPLAKKYIRPKIVATNVDSVIGTVGHVTESIDNTSAQGHVKLGSMEWTARSTSGAPIAAGTLVKADRIEGVKVFVSVAEESVKA